MVLYSHMDYMNIFVYGWGVDNILSKIFICEQNIADKIKALLLGLLTTLW